MNELFYTILNMSISASILVAVVLLLRFVFRKAPKWVNVLLWALVAIRLVCPFTLESPFSLMPETDFVVKDAITYDDIGFNSIPDNIPEYELGNDVSVHYYPTEPDIEIHRGISIDFMLNLIWLSGIAVMLIYMLVSYICVYRRIKGSTKFRDNIYTSNAVSSPFVFGIVKPKICLPENMDAVNMSYVIAHEEAHVRRRDHWWKPIGFILLAVHWFNPVIWLAYLLLCRDIEMACDERVIREMEERERVDYSEALLDCSVNRRMITACPLAFGESNVKERIRTVLSYKKPAFWIVILAVIACIVAAICFLTNPQKNDESDIAYTRYGIALSLPEAFKQDNVTIVSPDELSENTIAAFYQTAVLDYCEGWLFSVVRHDESQLLTEETNAGGFYYFAHDDLYWYGIMSPTDVQTDITSPVLSEEYDKLCSKKMEVIRLIMEKNPTLVSTSNTDVSAYVKNKQSNSVIVDDSLILVESIDTLSKPYENFLWAEKWDKYGWISGDGMSISRKFSEVANEIPQITYSNDFEIHYKEGVELISLSVYNSDFDRIHHKVKQEVLGDLSAGTYYLVITVKVQGEYIETEEKYENSAYECAYKFVIPDVTVENPLFHDTQNVLTLDDIIALCAKGYSLTWSDFEKYTYTETGSGLYIRVYEIDEIFELWIGGGNADSEPMYIYLTLADDLDTRIDIRCDDVVGFITNHKKAELEPTSFTNEDTVNFSYTLLTDSLEFNDPKTQIYSKMLNAIDHYNSAHIEFYPYMLSSNLKVVCELDLDSGKAYQASYVNGELTQEYFSDGETVSELNHNRKYYDTYYCEAFTRKDSEAIPLSKRITISSDGLPSYNYRRNVTNCTLSSYTLFPQELAFSYLCNFARWTIVKESTFIGRKCVVIEGNNSPYISEKHSANKFRLTVDSETGIVLMLTGEKNGKQTKMIEVTALELGIDSVYQGMLTDIDLSEYSIR